MPSLADQMNAHSPEHKPLLQSLLSTLADMDFAHEHEVARVLNKASTSPSMKATLLHRLGHQHRERREPYVRQISQLQSRQEVARAQARLPAPRNSR